MGGNYQKNVIKAPRDAASIRQSQMSSINTDIRPEESVRLAIRLEQA